MRNKDRSIPNVARCVASGSSAPPQSRPCGLLVGPEAWPHPMRGPRSWRRHDPAAPTCPPPVTVVLCPPYGQRARSERDGLVRSAAPRVSWSPTLVRAPRAAAPPLAVLPACSAGTHRISIARRAAPAIASNQRIQRTSGWRGQRARSGTSCRSGGAEVWWLRCHWPLILRTLRQNLGMIFTSACHSKRLRIFPTAEGGFVP